VDWKIFVIFGQYLALFSWNRYRPSYCRTFWAVVGIRSIRVSSEYLERDRGTLFFTGRSPVGTLYGNPMWGSTGVFFVRFGHAPVQRAGPKRSVFRDPIPTAFDLKDQIRHSSLTPVLWAGRVLLGQPCHCILHKCVARFDGDCAVADLL